jgi:hypothetical protein
MYQYSAMVPIAELYHAEADESRIPMRFQDVDGYHSSSFTGAIFASATFSARLVF